MFNLVIMYFHCEVKVSTQINGKELLHRKMQKFSTCGGLLRTFRAIFLAIQNIYVTSNPDMKLKLIKDEDGNPEALLTDLFEPHDYQNMIQLQYFSLTTAVCLHYASFIIIEERESKVMQGDTFLLWRVAFKNLFLFFFPTI